MNCFICGENLIPNILAVDCNEGVCHTWCMPHYEKWKELQPKQVTAPTAQED